MLLSPLDKVSRQAAALQTLVCLYFYSSVKKFDVCVISCHVHTKQMGIIEVPLTSA